MILKHKNIKNYFQNIYNNLVMTIMAIATIVGMNELPSHQAVKVVTPLVPVKVEVNSFNGTSLNPVRREEDETSLDYVSYNQSQRTHPRSKNYQ
jgi:hypothetical protein